MSALDAILYLNEYSVSFSGKVILDQIALTVPGPGIYLLMGPSGTGKSTLIRTICGLNDASPALEVSGEATYLGSPLGQREYPSIVVQKTRLLMASIRENLVSELPERHSLNLSQQRDVAGRLLRSAGLKHLVTRLDERAVSLELGEQRLLAIARTAASNPRMLMVDEPTAGVSDDWSEKIISYLRHLSETRAIFVIVHNQQQARKLGGTLYLLVEGKIVEERNTDDFLNSPESDLGKDFVRTGSCCSAPKPEAEFAQDDQEQQSDNLLDADTTSSIADVNESASGRGQRLVKSDVYGPRNFLWLRKGELAGTPRPGIYQDIEFDLRALQRVGVSVLASLEAEVEPASSVELEKFGIKGLFFPIKDMEAPDLYQAVEFIHSIHELVRNGESVAFHCKAGIGRTGTMLVACLVYEGTPALEALEMARKIEPRWVQSDRQVAFLEQFERHCSRIGGHDLGVMARTN